MLLLDSCSRVQQQYFRQAIYLAFNYAGNLDDYQQDGLLQIIYSANYNDGKVIYKNGATAITSDFGSEDSGSIPDAPAYQTNYLCNYK